MSNLTILGDTSGSVVLQAPAVSGSTTITFPAATGTAMVSGNMPAFSAYLNSSQTLSSGTATKITFDVEVFDTNNNFASSRFTPTVAGYYQFNALINVGVSATRNYLMIYKNGSLYQSGPDTGPSVSTYSSGVNSIVYLNGSTDYVEIYGVFATGQAVSTGSFYTWFNGSLLRAA